MALYFIDSSALVKRYVHEQGSVWVRETTASVGGHLIHISLLTVAELARILSSGYPGWCIRESCPRIWTSYLAKFREHNPFIQAGSDRAKTSAHAPNPSGFCLINDPFLRQRFSLRNNPARSLGC
jgi:hypothetical protein